MTDRFRIATELKTADWINTAQPLSIKQLRGKVVVIHVFQMLCPACVTHGLPQASAIHQLYLSHQVQLIGLHSVFENHEVMSAQALKAFIKEYKIQFPVAIDLPAVDGPIPLTMQDYKLRGTPTLILIDKSGKVRLSHFGHVGDMQVGNMIGQLLHDDEERTIKNNDDDQASARCTIDAISPE